jgi:putative oxidoreductase
MRRIYEQFYSGRLGIALLLLRVVVGLAFVLHGWPKVTDVAAFAGAMKLPLWLAGVGAYTELVGGILLLLGLLTPLAALFIAIEMLVALFKVLIPAGDPFVNPGGRSFETAAFYFVTMVTFLLAGPRASDAVTLSFDPEYRQAGKIRSQCQAEHADPARLIVVDEERILQINGLSRVTRPVVEAARESLVIGQT